MHDQRERYVDARELAAIMAVSVRTVRRWTAEGMPTENWGMSRCRRYRPSDAMRWARARSSGTISPNHNPARHGAPTPDNGPDIARHSNG